MFFRVWKHLIPSHADSSFVPPLIYSVLGSSRHLAVGPVSIASLVMGTMLREAVSDIDHPDLYLQLAFTSTFFAGLFQASLGFLRLILARVMICALILNLCLSIAQLCDLHLSQQFWGFHTRMMILCVDQHWKSVPAPQSCVRKLINCVICRLGFVIDFLSKATLVGFMAGAAVIVALQQLKGLLGIIHFTSKMQLVPVLSSVFGKRDEVESLNFYQLWSFML